jgi:hypothetical protein
MTIDEEYAESNNERIIEIFVRSGKVGVWIPAMATALKTVDKSLNVNNVEAVRVRKIEKK